MSLRIIVDSGSDILPDEAKELGITHLPLKVVFNDEEFEDAVNLTHKEFYEKLIESDALPTTCSASLLFSAALIFQDPCVLLTAA